MDKELDEELNWFAEDPVPAASPSIVSPSAPRAQPIPPLLPSLKLRTSAAQPRTRSHGRDGSSNKSKSRDNDDGEAAGSKKTKSEDPSDKKGKGPGGVDDVTINLPMELMSNPAKSAVEKLALLEKRDKLMRITLEKEKSTKRKTSTKGVCPDMCPEKERILRDVRGIVNSHEAYPDSYTMDHSKAVKEYARSSADQEEPLPHELRPVPVLRMTMDYLITVIMCKLDDNENENVGNWYDFCWGRLRAIRKDIIQQQLCDINTVTIVEECARFHICCFDRLWGASKSVFDDKINSETLMNCLKSIMYMYDDLRKQGMSCPNEAEFLAYMVLLKLHSGFVLSEFQQFPIELQKSPRVREAVAIHTAYSNNMYSTFFNLVKRTTYLNACLMQRFFGHLRTRALEVIVKSHCPPNKKDVRISVSYIAHTLKFDSHDDCIAFCADFGLSLDPDGAHFNVSRRDFFLPETMFTGTKSSSLVTNKRTPVAHSVLGHANLPTRIKHDVHSSFTDDHFLKTGALDASDQEEKMLRDTVARSMVAKGISVEEFQPVRTVPKVMELEDEDSGMTEPISDASPAGPYVEEEEEEDMEDIEEEDAGNEEFDDEPEGSEAESELPEDSLSHVKSSSSEECNEDSALSSSEVDSVSQKPFELPEPVKTLKTPEITSKFVFSPLKTPEPKKTPFVFFPSNEAGKQQFNDVSFVAKPVEQPVMKSPVTPPEQKTSKKPKLLKTQKSKQDYEDEILMVKLRKKLNEKMKHVAAKKCAKIWREKVEKIRRRRDSQGLALRHIPLEDYVKLWGCSQSKYTGRTLDRLNKRKKTNILVSALLHLNIIDQLDARVKAVGVKMADILGQVAVRWADRFGNIAQPQPVFWKLVLALPRRSADGEMFPTRLRLWCQAVFHAKMDPTADVCFWMSSAGVPVFIHPVFIEGIQDIEKTAKNFSAAVLITADGWESVEETQKRLKNLAALSSGSALSVLTLGDKPVPAALDQSDLHKFSHFEQSNWTDANVFVTTLFKLAQSHRMENLKVQPLGFLVEVTIEKFLDMLHQDEYLNEELGDFLTHPNNIIRLYNNLIDQLEKEISQCCFYNYYGLACELKPLVKTFKGTHDIFPSNYSDTAAFQTALRGHTSRLKLPDIPWDFTDSLGLLSAFRSYTAALDRPDLLARLIRTINPPDDATEHELRAYLRDDIQWIPLVENLAKSRITKDAYPFRVVFRDDKIRELTLSHWWIKSFKA